MVVADEVTTLPVWKRDATPTERINEIAHLSRECPAQFEKAVIIWHGVFKDGTPARKVSIAGASDLEAVGMLVSALKALA